LLFTAERKKCCHFVFLTAACCPKRDFYTHTHTHPPQKQQQTFVLHTQNSVSFVLRTQKSRPKSRPKSQQKGGKKAAKKSAKKVAKKAARKMGKKFIPEPVLLLS